jgi:hypothetical protein
MNRNIFVKMVVLALTSGAGSASIAADSLQVDQPVNVGMSNRSDHAVVIGIEDYDALGNAPFATSDAIAFARMLQTTMGMSAPGQVVTVLGKDATKATILDALATLGEFDKGRVWVYFSGHGMAHPGCEGANRIIEQCDDNRRNERLILPLETRPDAASIRQSGISVSDINKLAGNGGAEVLVITDACFTGSSKDGSNLTSSRLALFAEEQQSYEWSAASAGQTARPLTPKHHGAFTFALLGAARGWADGADGTPRDRVVTFTEANTFARDLLKAMGIYDQTPELSFTNSESPFVKAESGSPWEKTPGFLAGWTLDEPEPPQLGRTSPHPDDLGFLSIIDTRFAHPRRISLDGVELGTGKWSGPVTPGPHIIAVGDVRRTLLVDGEERLNWSVPSSSLWGTSAYRGIEIGGFILGAVGLGVGLGTYAVGQQNPDGLPSDAQTNAVRTGNILGWAGAGVGAVLGLSGAVIEILSKKTIHSEGL